MTTLGPLDPSCGWWVRGIYSTEELAERAQRSCSSRWQRAGGEDEMHQVDLLEGRIIVNSPKSYKKNMRHEVRMAG